MKPTIKGFDQITAWAGGALLGGAALGMFFWVSQCAVKKENAEKERLAKSAEKMLAESMQDATKANIGLAPANTPEVENAAASKSQSLYGYSGTLAPWRWMDLRPDWSLCGRGKRQSPIDISGARENPKLKALKFHYQHGVTVFSLANSTLHGDIEPGSWLDVDGDRYDLKSVDFRTPGEHRINGLPYELELQLKHEELSGRTLFLSVQFTNGKPNSEIKRVAAHLPRFEGETSRLERLVWQAFLPTKKTYWQYRGSLTYPPCTEDVAWTVLTSTVTASPGDIAAIAKLQRDNARPAQPLSGRHVARSYR